MALTVIRRSAPAAWRSAFVLSLSVITARCADVQTVLTRQVEARQLAGDMRVHFTKAGEASNRAVMADADDGAVSAADEARQAIDEAKQAMNTLQPLLESLGYAEERGHLDAFRAAFDQYLAIDSEILSLAVENSNVKAQRLSFGPAREASTAFRAALDRAVAAAPGDRREALAARAAADVLEIQALHAPHIAEAQDAAMTRMESEMSAADRAARRTLSSLREMLPAAAQTHVDQAAAALDRFMAVNAEIVTLSRRNSDVRSLALSLGRKRLLAAQADDQLRALQETLATRAFSATR